MNKGCTIFFQMFFLLVLSFSVSAASFTSLNSPNMCTGQWSNCDYAFADDNNRSLSSPSSTTNKTETFAKYDFSLPQDAVINSVGVNADFVSTSSSLGFLNIQVSTDGGVTYGPSHFVGGNSVERRFVIDFNDDFDWSREKLANSNLSVKVTCFKNGFGYNPVCRLDWIPVEVVFTSSQVIEPPTTVSSQSAVSIIPDDPLDDDKLTAQVSGFNDSSFNFNWLVDGSTLNNLNMPFTNSLYSEDNRTTKDLSSNSMNGKLMAPVGVGLPVFTSENCSVGGCYRFNGRNYINVSNNGLLGDGKHFSLSFWYDPERTINYPPWLLPAVSNTIFKTHTHALQVRLYKNTTLNVYEAGISTMNNSLNQNSFKSTLNVPADTKVFFTLLYDGDKGNLTVLVNGGQSISMKGVYGPIRSGGNYATIGSDGNSYITLPGVIGTIDEFMIFNRTLSVNQVKELYNRNYNVIVKEETSVGQKWQTVFTPVNNFGVAGSAVPSQEVFISGTFVSPSVSLTSPETGKFIVNPKSGVDFKFVPKQGSLEFSKAKLFGSWVGSFSEITTNTSKLVNKVVNSVNALNVPYGNFVWNVLVCDSQDNCAFSISNFTFFADNAPSLSSVSVSPSSPSSSSNLDAVSNGLTDIDGNDKVKLSNVANNWFVNNKSITVLSLPFTNNLFSSDGVTIPEFSGNNLQVNLVGARNSKKGVPQFTFLNCTVGGCYRFNSTNQVDVYDPNNKLLSMGNHYTFTFWYDPDGLSLPVGTRTYSVYSRRAVFYPESHRISIWKPNNSTVGIGVTHYNTSLNYNGWSFYLPSAGNKKMFVAVVYDGDKKNITVVIDGVVSRSNKAAWGPLMTRTRDNVYSFIGSDSGSLGPTTNSGVNGTLDEFVIFNRSLTPAQIALMYNQGRGNSRSLAKEELLSGQSWKVSSIPIDDDGLNGTSVTSAPVIVQ